MEDCINLLYTVVLVKSVEPADEIDLNDFRKMKPEEDYIFYEESCYVTAQLYPMEGSF